MRVIKPLILIFIFMGGLSGCFRVDTNPKPLFVEVQDEVVSRTGENLYWDQSIEPSIITVSLDTLLETELTDEKAVQIALLNNRNLQAIYENLGIAQANLAQAGLLQNPIFSFSYRFATKPGVTDLIDMSLLQNFLEILLIPLKKKVARAELEVTKAMVMAEALEVMSQTKIAFLTVQASEQMMQLKKDILLAAELSYEAAQRLHEAGNLRQLDLSVERSIYEQAKLEVASAEIAVLEARENLTVLMGLCGRDINWKLCHTFPPVPEQEEPFANIENRAIASSIDLKAAYHQLLVSANKYGIDTSKLIFPQFDLGVSAEREDSIWYVGPAFNLAIPLFDFGLANSAKARATIMREWNHYTALAVAIRSKARIARLTLLNAFRQSRYLEKVIIPLTEEITHLTLLQNNAMQIGVFDLLLSKRNELEKKLQMIQMQQDYWIAKVTLETLLNGHAIGLEVKK